MSILPNMQKGLLMRWLMPVSLALNICFVGAAGAVALRYTGEIPLSAVSRLDHSATDRLDRLAATLPPADAQVIRAELRFDEEKVAAAQVDLRLSQEEVRNVLRGEPFDAAAMRTAMAQVQVARDYYHQVLHQVIEASVVKMSVVGRNKIADWTRSGGSASPE
jgi:uncharacterized membrane protein